jgi:PilZ domain
VQATLNGWMEPAVDYISGDRRSRQRFVLRLPVEYRILTGQMASTGFGVTRDLSSSGLAFELDQELKPGCQVELTVQWPVPLEGGTPLKLVLRGTAVRSEHHMAAVRVHKCQFHTQKRARAAGAVDFAN